MYDQDLHLDSVGYTKNRSEHVTVEFWGTVAFEGATEVTPGR
jgi:hypothetical protein